MAASKRFRRLSIFFLSLFVLLALIAAAAGVWLYLYSQHLDRVVRDRFEGQRWALPARVYAQPLELYAGRPLSADDFVGELIRLGYQNEVRAGRHGGYRRSGDTVEVRTRAFRFWDAEEPRRHLRLTFSGGQLASMEDAAGGPDPALVRLDPLLIASIYPTHHEDRVLVKRADLPELLVNGLIAVEDRKFHYHHGVDPFGILRALYANYRAGTVVEGASTLTQQLVKNFYLSADRTIERKAKEAIMAMLLEHRYSKDEILEVYANEIYLGQDGQRAIHGFGLASQFYFDKPLEELDTAETALLVGLVQAPSSLDPRRHPEAARRRRNLVLDLMVRDDVISVSQAVSAKRQPLGIRDSSARPTGSYPGFISLVRRQLQRDYQDADLRSEGLNIFTTLDPLVQARAEQALPQGLTALEKTRGMRVGTLETAAVVTSVAQGEVLALVGGRQPGYAGFNRALDAARSIGSLVKPAIYLTALQRPDEYTLTTTIQDKPVSLPDGRKRWEPKNYNHKVYGSVLLTNALTRSLNLATVNLGLGLGLDEVTQTLYRLGAQRQIRERPSLLLGAIAMSPVEVAQVYQTLAAGGYRAPLRAIRAVVNVDGRPLNRYPLAIEQMADPRAVFLATWAMRRVVTSGTATWLGKQLPDGLTMAGKTGTTDDMRDSWFAGFSGDKVAVVWVGRDDNRPMGLSGSTGALRVWGKLMLGMENQPLADIPPEGVVTADACGLPGVPYIGEAAPVERCASSRSQPGQRVRRPAAPKPSSRPTAPPIAPPPPKPRPEPQPKRNVWQNPFM